MQFKDIVGQQLTKQHLIEMVEQNRLSHALLFLGKEGCGALPLALAFVVALVLVDVLGLIVAFVPFLPFVFVCNFVLVVVFAVV